MTWAASHLSQDGGVDQTHWLVYIAHRLAEEEFQEAREREAELKAEADPPIDGEHRDMDGKPG